MCDKLPYNNPRVDKCLIEEIKAINDEGIFKSLESCCGHGKYNKTIVVKERSTGKIYEYFSKIELEPKKRKRYYKKDSEGFYYVPEVLSALLLGQLGLGKSDFRIYFKNLDQTNKTKQKTKK